MSVKMADTLTSPTAAAAASSPAAASDATTSPKKLKKEKKTSTKRSKPNHPKTSEMVTEALSVLNEKNGSSLQAIKKYIVENFKVDSPEKLAPFIKRYIKSSVQSGVLKQTTGKGSSGSFMLAPTLDPERPKSERAGTRKRTPAKPKTSPVSPPKTKKQKVKKTAIKSPVSKKTTKTSKTTTATAAAKPQKKSLKAKKTIPTKTKKTAPKPKKMTPKKK